MSTDQKYDAQASNETFIDLTAKKPVNQDAASEEGAAQTADESHRQYWEQQYRLNVAECNECLAKYAGVHELVDRFVSEMNSADNVEVINELFFSWLAHSQRKKTKAFGRHINFNALRIMTFLVALHEQWLKATAIELPTTQTNQQAEEELSHE